MPLAPAITDLEQLKNHPAVARLVAWNREAVTRAKFDTFLKQSPTTAATVKNDTDREALFKQFQAWEADKADKNARAQVVPQAARPAASAK